MSLGTLRLMLLPPSVSFTLMKGRGKLWHNDANHIFDP